MTRMLDWLWETSERITNWLTFGVLLLLFIVFLVLFQNYAAHYPEKSFDGHRYGVSPTDIQRILKNFDEHRQLDQYLAQETQLDLAFPAIYGLLFAVAIVGIHPKTWHWLVAIPYATALFDYCENAAFIALVLHYRAAHDVPHALAAVASIASRLKWGFVSLSFAALVAALVRRYR